MNQPSALPASGGGGCGGCGGVWFAGICCLSTQLTRRPSGIHRIKVKLHCPYKVPQYRTRSSEIAFLRTVLVWLSTCIPYQLNIVSD